MIRRKRTDGDGDVLVAFSFFTSHIVEFNIHPLCISLHVGNIWKSFSLIYAGWWFGIFFVFPYIGNSHPN